jgi:carboxyl-terminal processing protease
MTDQEFQKFVRYTQRLGISASTREIFLSKALVKNRFKAYVGRNMFNDEGFYPIYHLQDHTLQKAVELLDNGEARL